MQFFAGDTGKELAIHGFELIQRREIYKAEKLEAPYSVDSMFFLAETEGGIFQVEKFGSLGLIGAANP